MRHRRHQVTAALISLSLTAATSSGGPQRQPAASPQSGAPPAARSVTNLVGNKAPEFALRDLDGKVWRLSELHGRNIVVLQFASISCECGQIAVYDLNELGRSFGAQGLQVLAIGFESQPLRPPGEFIKDSGLALPFLVDPDLRTAKKYHARWPPSVVVIDRLGIVRWACDDFQADVFKKTRAVVEPLVRADEAWNANSPYVGLYAKGTPITVSGTITAVERCTPLKGMSPATALTLRTRSGMTRAHLGPAWYVENQPVRLSAGDVVTVRGVSTHLNGKTIIIAARIDRGEDRLLLRDVNGEPVWLPALLGRFVSAMQDGQR